MSDEIMNTQPGQVGDLGGNAAQPSVNVTPQASGNGQSPDAEWWAQKEKEILAKAYQQSQSLVSKSENRQSTNMQSMIDKFKADFGVTLTPEQAQEMAANQAQRSVRNVPGQAQVQAQNANATVDPSFQGFKYYFGMNGSQNDALYRQCFEVQKTLGVELEKSDEEYQKLTHPETKYKPQEFVAAWKQACINKLVRLQSAQREGADNKGNTNLGQMPLVGGQGKKASTYDPKRTGKSYLSDYLKDKVVK